MKGRKPRADELDLWNRVARQVTPISKPPQLPDREPADQRKPAQQPAKSFDLPQISGGKTELKDHIAPPISQSLAAEPLRMDRKTFRDMRRGKRVPDARIDLHGMTLDRAHAALTRFVLSSHASGKRLLLVITGKGKHRDDGGPIPVRFGVLRHQVPQWLRLPPLAGVVLQVTEAHRSHGGGGAYYVYLRRA